MNTAAAVTQQIAEFTRVKIARDPKPKPESEMTQQVADGFRLNTKRAMSAFHLPYGDKRQTGIDVSDAARRIAAQFSNAEDIEFATNVAQEWEALTSAVVEHEKRLNIAMSNARELLTDCNESIASQVLKRELDKHESELCSVLAEKGIVPNINDWEAIFDKSDLVQHFAGFLKGEFNEDIDRHRSALVRLRNSVCGGTESRW